MSHQTGISASPELKVFFGKAKSDGVRFMKLSIENEELVLEKHLLPKGDWKSDYDKMVLANLDDKKPSYLLYRLDTKNNLGYEWLFIAWSPDFSPVREKMVYAATRATLKSEFGGGAIKEELFGTVEEDISLNGFLKHIEFQKAPAPLTFAEEELEIIRKTEVNTDVNIDTKNQTMQGLAFPIANDCVAALERLRNGLITYVQISIDIERERICLETEADIDVSSLPMKVPDNHARYHFFIFKHTHEGDFIESIVFIYSTPGYSIPVKERMLYSSCKSCFLSYVEQNMGMEIVKKVEISEGAELTEEFLQDELHPKKNIARQAFAKPKGPSNRGPKRMIRPTSDSSAVN
ncbi:twinfilin-1 [Octopus sinensis]|uniref:Twinfilin n=1 Tax=Octopus sinensis TaxID=2607531 RepID=A0A6P7SF58_9MOLL|nr:twinfilin-1 [Octopus sinensis]